MLIRQATRGDLQAIEGLLHANDLTTVAVADHLNEFLVAEENGIVVGSAGLELYPTAALLRSVAVDPAHRNRRIARKMVVRLLDRARDAGAHHVYLLTNTAPAYFAKFGFAPVSRDEVEKSVRASVEFTAECCESAQAMRLNLGAPDHPMG